jgi:hypothetical protein
MQQKVVWILPKLLQSQATLTQARPTLQVIPFQVKIILPANFTIPVKKLHHNVDICVDLFLNLS